MSEWSQDYAILRQGDERYKRQLGRVMMLIVERDAPNSERWEARTIDAKHCRILLTRGFPTKEEAMRAIEKKAGQLLHEALEDLAKSHL